MLLLSVIYIRLPPMAGSTSFKILLFKSLGYGSSDEPTVLSTLDPNELHRKYVQETQLRLHYMSFWLENRTIIATGPEGHYVISDAKGGDFLPSSFVGTS